eukprot:SM000385S14622  [mRNA]  locus=s385:14280:15298:+ [translate_table: standard]
MAAATPVYVNVYDLTPMNAYVYWCGLGIYHSGLEAHGVEYAFGAHDHPSSGVFEVEPRNTPGFTFRESILMGTTELPGPALRALVEAAAAEYAGNMYHLVGRNCNHFTDDVARRRRRRRRRRLKDLQGRCPAELDSYVKCMSYYTNEFEFCRKQQAAFEKQCPL